jgi:anti-sigma B factor antagonist
MSDVRAGELRAEIFGEGPWTVVQVSGEIDLATAPAFHDVLDLALERAASVVVDLAEVGFMDSSGALVLERTAALAAERHGVLAVRSARAQARKVLGIVGLADLLSDETGDQQGG